MSCSLYYLHFFSKHISPCCKTYHNSKQNQTIENLFTNITHFFLIYFACCFQGIQEAAAVVFLPLLLKEKGGSPEQFIKICTVSFSLFFKFLSSWSFVKSRPLWDLLNIISLTYLDSRSNESSRRNLAEKPVDFTGCRLLGGVYMITARLSFRGEMKSCTVFT